MFLICFNNENNAHMRILSFVFLCSSKIMVLVCLVCPS